MAIKSRNRGVAMFVVLGAIVLMTIFGLIGLELAKHFSDNSSSMVDMRSERMTAIGGLNLAVAAFEKDPTTTATLLEQYRQDAKSILSVLSLKSWVVFPTTATGTLSLSSSQTWAALSGTSTSVSSVSIKILGISAPSEDHADVTLEGHGRGRNGDEFVVQATYRVHGLGMSQNVPTKGPSNALQAQGGIDFINNAVTVDGAIYMGSSTTPTVVQGNGGGSITKLRTKGDLYLNKGAVVLQRSIVGGNLQVNSSDSSVFNDNLVVLNGLTATSTGRLHVKKNFLLRGTNSNGLKAPIIVDSGFYVENYFSSEVGDTVGGVAYFGGGLSLSGGNSYFGKSVFVEGGNCTFGTGNGVRFKAVGDFFMRSSGYSVALNAGGSVDTIMGNAFFNSPVNVTTGSMVVFGQSYFAGGVNGSDASGSDSIALFQDAFLARQSGNHKSFSNTVLIFGSRAIMNSQIDAAFGNVSSKAWKFRTSGFPRFWSFNASGTSYSSSTALSTLPISSVASFSARTSVANSGCMSWCQSSSNPNYWSMWNTWKAANPSCYSIWGWGSHSMSATCQSNWASYQTSQCNATCGGTTADTTVSWPWLSTATPLFPSYADLGFGADSVLDVTADVNQISVITWNNLPQTSRDAANWSTLWNKYKSSISGLSQSDAPSANQLDQLYQLVRADGGLYGGTDGYLLIHVSSWNWNGMSSVPLSSGTKIFFEFDNFGAGYLYAGCVGSYQIVDAYNVGDRVTQLGTLYGFVQLHSTSPVNYQSQSGTPVLYGSLEMGGGGTLRFNTSVSVSGTSAEALNVFQDIADKFSTGNKATAVIRFSGDYDQTTMSVVTQIKLKDGWVQFERLGEFR